MVSIDSISSGSRNNMPSLEEYCVRHACDDVVILANKGRQRFLRLQVLKTVPLDRVRQALCPRGGPQLPQQERRAPTRSPEGRVLVQDESAGNPRPIGERLPLHRDVMQEMVGQDDIEMTGADRQLQAVAHHSLPDVRHLDSLQQAVRTQVETDNVGVTREDPGGERSLADRDLEKARALREQAVDLLRPARMTCTRLDTGATDIAPRSPGRTLPHAC
jgi:hypothetical protein